ncbi:MAG TPA: hypothetical protein VN181_01825, partial [Thermoanaerobaculia bacterium]|nr:hypothetical protein [Thermoanaerobaculia bacterium]
MRENRAVAGLVLPAIVLLVALALIVPVRLNTYVNTEYWMSVALHDAFARGAHFGSDVVFTYGPWGFLLLPAFHAKTVALMFVLRAAVAAIGLAALWKLVERRAIALLLVAALAIVVSICGSDTFFELIPLLVLFYGFHRERDPNIYSPLIAAGGLLSLAKFSLFVMIFVAIAAVTLEELRRRVWPWTLACHALAIALWWLLARQRIADFLPFLRTSAELAAGYSEAMARDAAEYSPHTLLPFLISAIAFTIVLVVMERRRGALLIGGWLALLLLLFKSGFVRADHLHVAPACGVLLVIELAYLAPRARAR